MGSRTRGPACSPRRTRRVARLRRWQQARGRQVVETVNAQRTEGLGLHLPRARSKGGLLTRSAAKVAALHLGLWLHRCFGRPAWAWATLFRA
jgi:hypothetical protein